MKRQLASLLCATILSLAIIPAAQAQDSSMDAAIEKYIMEHPDVILKSLKKYRDRDSISDAEYSKLMTDSGAPVIGNKNGDVTIVEFFDYHCGYCKRFYPTISQLVEEDKGLKVVFKELPIISQDSEIAARASLAVYAMHPDKYFAFHAALMKVAGKYDVEKMRGLAQQAGIDADKLVATMNSEKVSQELEDNKKLAEELGVSGTPVVFVGKQMMPGAVDINTLRGKIKLARAKGAKKS